MQLTRHTDYGLRLLMHLAGISEGRALISEVAASQNISRTHLMKIANALSHAGFIDAVRGRGGGIRLALDPERINLGKVVAALEPGGPLVDCAGCRLARVCSLPCILDEAKAAFYKVLAGYSLSDFIRKRALPDRAKA